MWTDYRTPETLEEALAVLQSKDGRARVIAGGTDLALQAQRDEIAVECVVDVTRIPQLQSIVMDGEDVVLGACVTHAQAAASPLLLERAPVLAAACASVGSPQIRNVGTIAGNIVNAQPAADSVTALLALDASVDILGAAGVRQEPVGRLFKAPGQSAVDPSREIVTAIRFRALAPDVCSAFARLARRRALALPMLNVAVVAKVCGNSITWARIAVGPVAPTPFRATRAEAALQGAPASLDSISRAADAASDEAQPRSSLLRGSREYRKAMVRVYVRRALAQALGLTST